MWPTQGWRASTPEEQGFDSAKLEEELRSLKKRSHIDSLLMVRNGYVVLDAYFYPYDNLLPHKLASITKSVMTTLIGIAADQGKIRLDQPMLSYFPGRTIANLDVRKQHITIRHLASMRNGFESGCLSGDAPTLSQMRSKSDWVQAALDRVMVEEPGTRFCYDSPGMHLLSAILQQATGMMALDFARQYLFEPLGIREVTWQSDPQGYTAGWGNLFLKPRDAAKIGYLWLKGGVWEGQPIISAAWVTESVKPWSSAGADDYGYGWWVSKDSYYAFGRGGQYIKVYPAYDVVVVATAGGLEYGELEPLLAAGFVDPNQRLPANPAGITRLTSTLTALAQSSTPYPVKPLPDTAKAISGKTVVFGPNAGGVEAMRLEFNTATVATLSLDCRGKIELWLIGLDGKYRPSPDGLARRGYWADEQTFTFEVFEIGPRITYRVHVGHDRVEISVPEREFKLEGQIGIPAG
jgi:CubicO group peptidase (beta-lactamase class C family)